MGGRKRRGLASGGGGWAIAWFLLELELRKASQTNQALEMDRGSGDGRVRRPTWSVADPIQQQRRHVPTYIVGVVSWIERVLWLARSSTDLTMYGSPAKQEAQFRPGAADDVLAVPSNSGQRQPVYTSSFRHLWQAAPDTSACISVCRPCIRDPNAERPGLPQPAGRHCDLGWMGGCC